MREWIIKKLGGYTELQYVALTDYCDYIQGEMENNANTIRELQALVPVSAVLPKKRGRPRKALKA